MPLEPDSIAAGSASAQELRDAFSSQGYVCLRSFLGEAEAQATRDSLLEDISARLDALPREHVSSTLHPLEANGSNGGHWSGRRRRKKSKKGKGNGNKGDRWPVGTASRPRLCKKSCAASRG